MWVHIGGGITGGGVEIRFNAQRAFKLPVEDLLEITIIPDKAMVGFLW